MNREQIRSAADLAEEFADLARRVSAGPDSQYICGTKLTGQLRRASLDLTRKLADMRRPS